MQYEKFAGAIMVFPILSIMIVAACQAEGQRSVLSRRFNVCADIPPAMTVKERNEYYDYDIVTMDVAGDLVEVQVGGYPMFSHQALLEGLTATDRFEFIGREKSDGKDRMLYAYRRGGKRGVMFVMFMSDDLSMFERIVAKNVNLLLECK